MKLFVLVGIDPLDQPGVDVIYKFNDIEEAYLFVKEWIDDRSRYIFTERPSVKIESLLNNTCSKYMSHLKVNNFIHFYDRCYKNQESSEQYEYKWSIHCV